ncbi:Protein strawberry notch-like protein, partial [Cynara cardunculus var. scolymus]
CFAPEKKGPCNFRTTLDADHAIQQFGRTRRSNQTSAQVQDSLPVVLPNCSSENPAIIRDFIEKGKDALVSVGVVRDAVCYSSQFLVALFAIGKGKDSGMFSSRIVDSDMNDVGCFLNRLLGLSPEIQNRLCILISTLWFFCLVLWCLVALVISCRLFELFVSILDHLLQLACLEGQLDTGIVDMKANTIELQGTPKTVQQSYAWASTELFMFVIDHVITWEVLVLKSVLVLEEAKADISVQMAMMEYDLSIFPGKDDTLMLMTEMQSDSATSALLSEKQRDVSGSSDNEFNESKREWLGRRHFHLVVEGYQSLV